MVKIRKTNGKENGLPEELERSDIKVFRLQIGEVCHLG